MAATAAADPATMAEQRELVELVWDAAASLNPREYSLLDLHVRRGLTADELATTLGQRKGAVYTMLSRLRNSLGETVTFTLLLRQGRRDCAELSALVGGNVAAELSPATRRVMRRHLQGCATCQERARRVAAPAEIFALIPLLPVAPEQQAAVWRGVAGHIDVAVAGGGVAAAAASQHPGQLLQHLWADASSLAKTVGLAATTVATATLLGGIGAADVQRRRSAGRSAGDRRPGRWRGRRPRARHPGRLDHADAWRGRGSAGPTHLYASPLNADGRRAGRHAIGGHGHAHPGRDNAGGARPEHDGQCGGRPARRRAGALRRAGADCHGPDDPEPTPANRNAQRDRHAAADLDGRAKRDRVRHRDADAGAGRQRSPDRGDAGARRRAGHADRGANRGAVLPARAAPPRAVHPDAEAKPAHANADRARPGKSAHRHSHAHHAQHADPVADRATATATAVPAPSPTPSIDRHAVNSAVGDCHGDRRGNPEIGADRDCQPDGDADPRADIDPHADTEAAARPSAGDARASKQQHRPGGAR